MAGRRFGLSSQPRRSPVNRSLTCRVMGWGVRWVYFPAPPSVHEFTTMQTRLDDRILSDLNRQFDASPPEEIVRWALSEPSLKRVAIASAFQVEGTCLIH